MSDYTLSPSGADGVARLGSSQTVVLEALTADGHVYGSSASYATARSTYSGASSAASTVTVGQTYSGGTYICFEGLIGFDTSPIPDGADIESVTLELYGTYEASSIVLELREMDWQGSVGSGDWVAGADLGDSALLATYDTADGWTSAYRTFENESGGGLEAVLAKAGTCYLQVTSQRQRLGNTPSGAEYVNFSSGEGEEPPRLTVTYSGLLTRYEYIVGGTADASATASAATLEAPDSGGTDLDAANADATAAAASVATRYRYIIGGTADAVASMTASVEGDTRYVVYADTMDALGAGDAAYLAFEGGSTRTLVPEAGDATAATAATLTHYGTEHVTPATAAATATARVLILKKTADAVPPAYPPPAQAFTAALIVGSEALGWMDLAADAVLETMTRAMPGGDGSLEWTLSGDAVGKYRNVLAPGASVRLYVNGAGIWSGRLANDPVGSRVVPETTVTCVAAGLNSWAARHQVYGYAAIDSDEQQWVRVASMYDSGTAYLESLEDAGKFTTSTEGTLLVKAEGGRAYDDYAKCRLSYWLFSGYDLGAEAVGISFEYKAYLPSSWEARIRTCDHPWAETSSQEWTRLDSQTSWTAVNTDFASPNACVQLTLFWNATGSTTPTTAPYVRLRDVKVYCRLEGASVDRTVTAGTAMGDVASEAGFAALTDCDALTSDLEHLMVRVEPPKTMADALREIAAECEYYVEYGFYLDPSGLDAFYATVRPDTVDEARNTLWDYGGRAGEETSGLERDTEAAPDYVWLSYRLAESDEMAKGAPQEVWYPSDPGGFAANVLAVTEYADVPLTAVRAAAFAERIWTERQAAQWSGQLTFTDRAMTSSGREQPSFMVRPGDRVKIPALEDAEGLYVAETSYDFAAMTCSATIGHPWEFLLPVPGWTRQGRPEHVEPWIRN